MWNANKLEWIDIELTSFCNISCNGCFRTLSNFSNKILNKEILTYEIIKKKFIKNIFPNIKIINFCGSVDEPCSHPEFFNIIKHFNEWGHINIATNGSLRTENWWIQLANILPKSHKVTFGIDGIDETSELYRIGSNFKKVQKNYRAFIKAGGNAVWQFIVFEHNKHQHIEAKKIAKKEGFKNFQTIYSHREDNKKLEHIRKNNNNNKKIECKYLDQKRIFINHNGNVIPCCHLNSEMLEWNVGRKNLTEFGNIVDKNYGKLSSNLQYNNIDEIIEGDFFNDIVESWDTKKIKKCVETCMNKKSDIFEKETL